MFPSDQSNELRFPDNSSIHHQHVPKNINFTHNSMDGSNLNNSARESRRPGKNLLFSEDYENKSDHYQKKLMHRDMEKQRRKELSALHASLRSLLPLEYIKGKRSMSDHLNETLNYIKDLKNNLKQLSAKRDELKKLSDLSVSGSGSGSTDNNFSYSVMVHPCLGGLEIVIRQSFKDQVLPLSRILELLLEEGLEVVNCISRNVNDQTLLLTIQTQASDPKCFDLPRLQQKLTEVVIAHH